MLSRFFVLVSLFLVLRNSVSAQISTKKFPADFKWGVATAAYQIEGGWNLDGKGPNIWDEFCHSDPDRIKNRDNGDVACDSYHKYKEDVQLIKNLNVKYYRFSLGWSRILPTGRIDQINQAGIDYYKNLIQELRNNGIEIMITLYHWDLPQALQTIGGWPNEALIDAFGDYARLAYQEFGNDVKYWATFNEVKQTCHAGYGDGNHAPGIYSSGQLEYACTHTVLKSHARAYHIYNDEFKKQQGGQVSMVIDSDWFEPASNSAQDTEAAERMIQFNFGWYANAIWRGNYPQVMIDRIADRSRQENLPQSRLPEFTQEEIDYIKGTSDFFAVNGYTSSMAKWKADAPIGDISYYNDVSVDTYKDESWKHSASDWLRVVPWGFRKLLNWIQKEYNPSEIIITENGVSDSGGLHDQDRIDYYQSYLDAVQQAMYDDNINVTGYFAWSLLDNFEWTNGYTERFGLISVDFNSPNRTRTLKDSANYYKWVAETGCLITGCE